MIWDSLCQKSGRSRSATQASRQLLTGERLPVLRLHSSSIIKHLQENLTTGKWFALKRNYQGWFPASQPPLHILKFCSESGRHAGPATDRTSFLWNPSSFSLLDKCTGRWFGNAVWQGQYSVIIISSSSSGPPAKPSKPAERRQPRSC